MVLLMCSEKPTENDHLYLAISICSVEYFITSQLIVLVLQPLPFLFSLLCSVSVKTL